jgi:hypothetical protein
MHENAYLGGKTSLDLSYLVDIDFRRVAKTRHVNLLFFSAADQCPPTQSRKPENASSSNWDLLPKFAGSQTIENPAKLTANCTSIIRGDDFSVVKTVPVGKRPRGN